MKTLKTKGKITDYDEETGRFAGFLQTEDRGYMTQLRSYVGEKQWKFELGRHFNRPSTGDDSQFHHYWGHLQQLADSQGEEIRALDEVCRREAVDRGQFAFDVVVGMPIPWRLSDERVDSREMSRLIEYVHDFGAIHYDFVFYEGDHEDRGKESATSVFEQEIQRMLRDSAV